MNATSGLMFAILLIAAFLPFGLVFQYSNWQHSRYRNRLWNIRDSLVDELLDGNIEFSQGTQALLHVIETHIRNTRRHTFTDVMVAVFLLRNVELPPITDLMLDDAVRPEDRKVLMRYFVDFREANFSYLKRSSPSGWLVGLRLKLNKSRRQPSHDREEHSPALRQQVESAELRAIPELAPPAREIRRGPLIDDSMSLA
ncbi:hypothetical protein [Micromonospora sp. WMMD975]|uniref:hypothetical protein n=1 Tax=Micromonospora sp. WMMD975 TaxID=3016087 RepID=UPI00249AEE8B|nr:hypothetical protein [Micromonospora sp. WMMD975]WFE32061.1 hypothetical protein O7613_21055 [Micromonospora sp. WMMD975]